MPARFRVAFSIAVLLIAASLLLYLQARPHYGLFENRKSAFSTHNQNTETGAALGTLPLKKGVHYVVSVQSNATAPFELFLRLPDRQASKILIIDLTPDATSRPIESVVPAPRDAAAAELVVAAIPGKPAQSITFRSLTVTELDSRYYFWRNLITVVPYAAILASIAYLLLCLYRRCTALYFAEGDRRLRIAGCWAAALLVVGGGFSGYFLKSRHEGLFKTPFHSSISGWDASFYYVWLRSAMVDHDVDFTNDLLYCNTLSLAYRREIVRDTPRTATGLIPDKYPIGFALLSAPWYVAGSLAAHLANFLGEDVLYDGWGPMYQIFLVLGQIIYAIGGLYFAWKILNEYFPPPVSVCAVMLGWLGSPLYFYQTVDVFMSHNVMFFAMTGAYYYSFRLLENPRKRIYWLLVGLLCAFVILARYQGAVMLVFPGFVCLREAMKDCRQLVGFAIGVVAGALPILLQMMAWKAVFGSYFLYTYQGETFSWLHPHLYDVLFSSFHGLFNWQPMMLVGFAGFTAWAAFARRSFAAGCFAASLALAVYINAAWDCWWFGASFGSRAFETCTLFSMLGIAYLLTLLARRAFLFHAGTFLLLLIALWNMNMVGLVRSATMPLEKSISWKERIQLTGRLWSKSI